MNNVLERFELKGKVALVTGGSRGLGLQMAQALGGAGATVVITARKADELDDARRRLESAGIRVHAKVCDIGRHQAIPDAIAAIVEEAGCIDILLNNAGATWGSPAEDYSLAGWQKVMDVNLTGTFLVTQEVAKRCMIPRKSGSIINIASVGGMRGGINFQFVGYSTSKAGVIQMTRALAAEWGKHGIRVNAISPGVFLTKMMAGTSAETHATYVARTPLGRLGREGDLDGIALLFASDASSFITGQVMVVDGGNVIT